MGPRRRPGSLSVQLFGRPRITRTAGAGYQFRSRKSWAVLAVLLLSDRPPSRSRLAELLFADADDPGRALRWSLTEIRRGLGDGASVDGDPLVLQLPPDTVVDAKVVSAAAWGEAVQLPGLGAELLEGLSIRGAAGFETWLLSERRHLAAATEAILHEAALGSMARGELETALRYAVRVASLSPLDENHQALLIRLYRLTGDLDAAARQYAACVQTFEQELGTRPGAAVAAAMRESPHEVQVTNEATIGALIEAGSAAVSAGAHGAGIDSLRTAARMADRHCTPQLQIRSRLELAEALIHAFGGLDEEGLSSLFEVDEIAQQHQSSEAVARARAELGYVDMLRARYDRAEFWLTSAMEYAEKSPAMMAKATTYLGSVDSDRANYRSASSWLGDAVSYAQVAGDPRREAYALAMRGRVSLLYGDLDSAAEQLDSSIEIASDDHWLSFVPWPQALRGDVQLARGDTPGASELLEHAFARACQLGDPCWEGIAARGLAMVAEASGDSGSAFDTLADARARCRRFADPYVWLDAYILDAQCTLGLRYDHRDTSAWISTMQELASRTGMKEFVVRSLLHGAALGNSGDASAAVLLAADIESPVISRLLNESDLNFP